MLGDRDKRYINLLIITLPPNRPASDYLRLMSADNLYK